MVNSGLFPPKPPGLEIKIRRTPSGETLLRRTFPYNTALSFLREHQRTQWENPVTEHFAFNLPPPTNVLIVLRPNPGSELFNDSFVMLGVYDAVFYIISHRFCAAQVNFAMNGQDIGFLRFTYTSG